MALLVLDLLARVKARRVNREPPFSALFTLWLFNDCGCWAALSSRHLPTPDIKRVMDPIERAVIVPAAEIVIHRAARRQILRQGGPLAPCREDDTSVR